MAVVVPSEDQASLWRVPRAPSVCCAAPRAPCPLGGLTARGVCVVLEALWPGRPFPPSRTVTWVGVWGGWGGAALPAPSLRRGAPDPTATPIASYRRWAARLEGTDTSTRLSLMALRDGKVLSIVQQVILPVGTYYKCDVSAISAICMGRCENRARCTNKFVTPSYPMEQCEGPPNIHTSK